MTRAKKNPTRRRVEQGLVRLLSATADLLARKLSLRAMRRIAVVLAWLIYHLIPSRQRLAERNLRAVFGERLSAAQRRRIRWQSTVNICKTMIELFKLPYMTDEQLRAATTLEGVEHLRAALERGRGVILLTAHFGNWEMGGARLALEGFPIYAVARDSKEALTATLINRARARRVVEVLSRDDTYAMIRALRANACLAILPDQHAAAGGEWLEFLGRPASTHRGPARLADRMGCVVLPCFSYREPDGTIAGRVYPALELAASEDHEQNISANSQLINDVVGEQIRARPEQWLWLHDRWKERGEGTEGEGDKGTGRQGETTTTNGPPSDGGDRQETASSASPPTPFPRGLQPTRERGEEGEGGEKILLIKMSALGDVVRALPLLASLKESRPEVRVGWAVDQRFAEILRGHPYLEWIHPLPRAWSRWWWQPELRRLRDVRYDTSVDVQGRFKSALAGVLARCRRRIGIDRRRWTMGPFGYTEVVPLGWPATAETMLEMATPLGADKSRARNYLPIPEANAQRAAELLAPLGEAGPLVALAPGASTPQKRWPAEHFAELAQRLRARGARIVVVGAPEERELAEKVVELARGGDRLEACPTDGNGNRGRETAPTQMLSLAGETSLSVLAAVLARCDLTVAGDTGPAHLAAVLGGCVVALFGPTEGRIHRPWGQGNVALQSPYDCKPCNRHPHCERYDCMYALSVSEVLAACEQALKDIGVVAEEAGQISAGAK